MADRLIQILIWLEDLRKDYMVLIIFRQLHEGAACASLTFCFINQETHTNEYYFQKYLCASPHFMIEPMATLLSSFPTMVTSDPHLIHLIPFP